MQKSAAGENVTLHSKIKTKNQLAAGDNLLKIAIYYVKYVYLRVQYHVSNIP